MDYIYFDNAATSFPKPEQVYKSMDEAARNYGVNAGRGGYSLANKASLLIDETRNLFSKIIDFDKPDRIVFNPSATIALNSVLFGLDWQEGENVFYSPFEHNSVLRPLEALKNKLHLNLYEIPFNKEAFIYDINKLEELYGKFKPRLTVVSHASNVCGLIAPVKEISKLSHKYGGQVLIDGAQTIGLVPFDIREVNCDYLVFAGHKNLFGPIGIGGVVINNTDTLEPYIIGGTGSNSEEVVMPSDYPARLEAGSPNIVAIAGLNAGIKWLNSQDDFLEKDKMLLRRLLEVIDQFSEVSVVGTMKIDNMVPVISLTFQGYTPQETASILDQKFNIAVRAGLHCSPAAHKTLDTLPYGTVRISINNFNREEDFGKLYHAFEQMYY